MANSYKNIVITPNIGNTADPKIVFSGGNTSVNTDISMFVYPESNGTLSFEGSAGQLFSITNDLSGSIFSVNDISGLPSLEIFANGQISLAPYGGTVAFGNSSSISAPIYYDSANTSFYIDPASTGTSFNMAGSIRQATYNKPGILSVAANASSVGGSIAIQQETAEGWTAIFADYEPYAGWGLWHDNPNNFFAFTAETSTGQIRSFTVPSRVSGNRTAYEKFRVDQNNGDIIAGRDSYAQSSMRAPIFYDNNDTGYYIDPNSTADAALRMRGGALFGPNVSWGEYLYVGGNGRVGTSATVAVTNGNLHLDSKDGSSTYLNWYSQQNIYTGTSAFLGLGNNTASHRLHVHGTGLATVDFRAPIFYDSADTGFFLDPASTTTSVQIAGAIEQGNNFAHPNIEWSASGASTGMVIFSLPGGAANYGMVHMVFDIYEYTGAKISTVIVGGHNWNSAWYNPTCQVIGNFDKTVRLGFKDSKYCVVFGGAASTWDYGTIRLRKIHNGSYYNNIVDLGGAYTAAQTTTESFTAVTADLRYLRTPTTFQADVDVRAPVFYDLSDTAYYVNPASTTNINNLYIQGGVAGVAATASYFDAAIEVREYGFGGAQTDSWAYAPRIGFHWSGRIASQIAMSSLGRISILNNPGNAFEALESGNFYAPIFYDSADTTYYVDPGNATTAANLNGDVYVKNGRIVISRGPDTFTTYVEDDSSSNRAQLLLQSDYSDLVLMSREANANRHGSTITLATQSTANTDYAKWVIGQGQYEEGSNQLAFSYGVNSVNPHTILGTDNANYKFLIQGDGTTYSSTASYAPVFYDLNNTAYYLDPAGTSVLNTVFAEGSEVLTVNLNTAAGNGYWDLNGNFAFQKIYGDHSPFNNEAVYNAAFYRGGNWTLYGWNGSVWTNLGAVAAITDGRLSTITLSRTYSEFIIDMSNSLGYTFMSAITFVHSTNGNSFNFFFEKSTSSTYNSGTWTAMTSLTGINSWPGGTSLKFSDVVGGGYPAFARIRIVPTWSHASNDINFGGLTISASYGGRNQLMTWDSSYNISTVGSFRAPAFYDSDNTTYFVDPTSISSFNQARFNGRIGINDGNGVPFTNVGSPGIWLGYSGGANMFMGSQTATLWGLYISSDWRFTVNDAGSVAATGDMRAPIFYDSANTSFYVDPGSSTTSAVFAGKVLIGGTTAYSDADLQLTNGDDSTGSASKAQLSFQWTSIGYSHYITSRHNNVASSDGNALLFYLNNSTTQGASSGPGTGSVISKFMGVQTHRWYTENAERMRLNANGSLSIGTTSAFYEEANRRTFNLNGANSAALTLAYGDSPKFGFTVSDQSPSVGISSGTNITMHAQNASYIDIWTNSNSRLYIGSGGNIGIGNTAPAEKLVITDLKDGSLSNPIELINTGTSINTEIGFKFAVGTTPTEIGRITMARTVNNPVGSVIKFLNRDSLGSMAEAMRISVAGNVGIGNTAPAHKLRVQGDISLSGGIDANGSFGTAGQVLTSNGSVTYWANASGGTTASRAIAMSILFG